MIRKVYTKIFILLFIFLLASNENLSSIKYSVCEDERISPGERFLFTKDFHNNIDLHRPYHKCIPGLEINYRVYDNEFYNFICSVKTDNYGAYIFFRVLENILSECSGVYCRKKVNRYFGFFYGSVIGFFFNNSRLYFKKKIFTIEFLNGLRFNLVSALMYITKAMLVENFYIQDMDEMRKFKMHIRYAIECINGINGFHIIHVNFSKIITLSFFNILKIILVILNKLQYSFELVRKLFSNMEQWWGFFRWDTYVGDNKEEMRLNPNEELDHTSYVKLYTYNVFNGFIHIKEKDEGLPRSKIKYINNLTGLEYTEDLTYDNFDLFEWECSEGRLSSDSQMYNVVKEVKSIRRRNRIANILNYIWFTLAPSISFDLTQFFQVNKK